MVEGVGLRPLVCGDCGFESSRGHGCRSCECCALSGRGLCVGLITRPEESYRVRVSECDREASVKRKPWPSSGCRAMGGKTLKYNDLKEDRFILILSEKASLSEVHACALHINIRKMAKFITWLAG